MENKRKLTDSLSNLRETVNKLKRALDIPRDGELIVEGTIQRFEYVVEILWKTLRRALIFEGAVLRPDTAREVMIQGFTAGFLHGEVTWQELLDMRNKTSHEYLDEEFIEDYYNSIIRLTPEIENVLTLLEETYKE